MSHGTVAAGTRGARRCFPSPCRCTMMAFMGGERRVFEWSLREGSRAFALIAIHHLQLPLASELAEQRRLMRLPQKTFTFMASYLSFHVDECFTRIFPGYWRNGSLTADLSESFQKKNKGQRSVANTIVLKRRLLPLTWPLTLACGSSLLLIIFPPLSEPGQRA